MEHRSFERSRAAVAQSPEHSIPYDITVRWELSIGSMIDSTEPDNKAETAPALLNIVIRGIDADPEWLEEFQRANIVVSEWKAYFLHVLESHIRQLSTFIDLSDLDGVTVAGDYRQA